MTTQSWQAPRHLRQLNAHNPERGIYGDCHRTCLAMLLGWNAEDIPNWGDSSVFGDGWREAKRAWFKERGLGLICFAMELPSVNSVLDFIGCWASGPIELSGKSPRGNWNHAVVVSEGRILDPHPSDDGLVGPCDDGYFWIEAVTALPGAMLLPESPNHPSVEAVS